MTIPNDCVPGVHGMLGVAGSALTLRGKNDHSGLVIETLPATPSTPSRELTRDEEAAERGARVRACLCASWELEALGRCVCPGAREEDGSRGDEMHSRRGVRAETSTRPRALSVAATDQAGGHPSPVAPKSRGCVRVGVVAQLERVMSADPLKCSAPTRRAAVVGGGSCVHDASGGVNVGSFFYRGASLSAGRITTTKHRPAFSSETASETTPLQTHTVHEGRSDRR